MSRSLSASYPCEHARPLGQLCDHAAERRSHTASMCGHSRVATRLHALVLHSHAATHIGNAVYATYRLALRTKGIRRNPCVTTQPHAPSRVALRCHCTASAPVTHDSSLSAPQHCAPSWYPSRHHLATLGSNPQGPRPSGLGPFECVCRHLPRL